MASNSGQVSWEQAVLWLKSQPEYDDLVKACFYDDPLLESAKRFHTCTEWKAIQKIIGSPQGRALDIGAGRGISSFALAKDGWQTVALEPDDSQIVGAAAIRQLAIEGGVSIEVVEKMGEELPFENASFDLVYVRQALHHARDLNKLCREIGRVLKPGGMMIAGREHVISRPEDLEQFLKSHPLHHLYGGENAYLLDDYLGAISGGGIQLTKVFNPLESDINLYPETVTSIKEQMARKYRLPSKNLIPDGLLSVKGKMMNNPGRLYTFFGYRREDDISKK